MKLFLYCKTIIKIIVISIGIATIVIVVVVTHHFLCFLLHASCSRVTALLYIYTYHLSCISFTIQYNTLSKVVQIKAERLAGGEEIKRELANNMAMGAGLVAFLLMVLVQFVYAVMNITSKLAIESGMSPLVLVAYRQLFATVSIAPFAYWLEWKTLPRITKRLMVQILISSLTGITGNQILYFVGLKYSTATIACALTNLLPAFTFILAVIFRQENLGIKKRAGLAKVFGTTLCVSGALLLSFYHGKTIGLGQSSIHWRYAEKMEGSSSSAATGNMFIGPIVVILSTLVWALWFIVQKDISKNFPAPYTSTGIMCLMASFQCMFIALCVDHTAAAWSLHNPMRLSSALYAGIFCTGLAYCIMSWTIERKGPLYVSVFTPLQLVLTAILSWALLREKLYVGTAVGALLIVLGLYSVLWGKSEEVNKEDGIEDAVKDPKIDMELQSYVASNSNNRRVNA